jgi:putative FmdB family regulatory protein
MPIYEYRCETCGHELEVMQRISADPLRDCPSCKTDGLRRRISLTSFALKGSGWYATDYKGTGAKSAEAKDKAKSETTESAPKESTSKESTPKATKAEVSAS